MKQNQHPTLSDRQAAALAFIKDFIKVQGFSPSIREIGEHIGVNSTSLMHHYLDGLERAGKIRRDGNIARSIVVVE